MPNLDLDWEVGAFRALRSLWRWVRPTAPERRSVSAVPLGEVDRTLLPLARWVAGSEVQLLPAREVGGVRGQDLLLPSAIDAHADPEVNRGLFVLRVVVGAEMTRWMDRVPQDAEGRLRVELVALAAALRACRGSFGRFHEAWLEALEVEARARPAPQDVRARAVEALRWRVARGESFDTGEVLRLPAADPRAAAPRPFLLWGEVFQHTERGDAIEQGADAAVSSHVGTEAEAPPVEDLRHVRLDARGEDKVVNHTFEKVETADAWEGNALRADGADELEDELEALEEVDLGDLVRGGPPARSVLKADIGEGLGIPDVHHVDPSERGIPYDEWDAREGRYREGWCTVYPARMTSSRTDLAEEAAHRNRRREEDLYRRLRELRAERAWANRQRDGDHPDIDALVMRQADLASGRSGDERLYLRAVPRRRNLITTVLLDVSLSADSWVQGRQVLAVSRDAVSVIAAVAERLDDRLQVRAFASNTRNRCRVWEVKDQAERWSTVRGRLFALEPQGYTRIGAALRHATAELARQPAAARLLLLVGDGKPTDYDRYEGAHGRADVHHAVHDARKVGVHVHGLAIDPGARWAMPAMFGRGRWSAADDPDRLAEALAEVYGRLTASL
ncbi:MAG: VWA domain-containing protein [Alphaproteobacteria bacterium]|nr:VWA domain-containing protein [Alphaproteobacteria bacterium]